MDDSSTYGRHHENSIHGRIDYDEQMHLLMLRHTTNDSPDLSAGDVIATTTHVVGATRFPYGARLRQVETQMLQRRAPRVPSLTNKKKSCHSRPVDVLASQLSSLKQSEYYLRWDSLSFEENQFAEARHVR